MQQTTLELFRYKDRIGDDDRIRQTNSEIGLSFCSRRIVEAFTGLDLSNQILPPFTCIEFQFKDPVSRGTHYMCDLTLQAL